MKLLKIILMVLDILITLPFRIVAWIVAGIQILYYVATKTLTFKESCEAFMIGVYQAVEDWKKFINRK